MLSSAREIKSDSRPFLIVYDGVFKQKNVFLICPHCLVQQGTQMIEPSLLAMFAQFVVFPLEVEMHCNHRPFDFDFQAFCWVQKHRSFGINDFHQNIIILQSPEVRITGRLMLKRKPFVSEGLWSRVRKVLGKVVPMLILVLRGKDGVKIFEVGQKEDQNCKVMLVPIFEDSLCVGFPKEKIV